MTTRDNANIFGCEFCQYQALSQIDVGSIVTVDRGPSFSAVLRFVKFGNFLVAVCKTGVSAFLDDKNVADFIVDKVAKNVALAYCLIPSDGLLGDLVASLGKGENFDSRFVGIGLIDEKSLVAYNGSSK